MIVNFIFLILNALITLFGFLISPILALFPNFDLSSVTSYLVNLISQGIGLVRYLLGDGVFVFISDF